MNKELINQLVQQVGTDTSGKWINTDRMDQFAELIVRECAQQAHDLADVLSMHRDKSGAEIAESIGNTIKEHFGVIK